MVDIHHEGSANAPLHVAFAYIDDYRTTPEWMFGISQFEPVGELDHGKGAVFQGTFQVKPVKLHSTVECTDWEQDRLIAFNSIKGFRNWSTWRFERISDNQTKVIVDFTYELPGGLAGKALGKALEPIVALTVRHSDAALRRNVEARWAAEQAG
jgi:uncharacterized membrane protein